MISTGLVVKEFTDWTILLFLFDLIYFKYPYFLIILYMIKVYLRYLYYIPYLFFYLIKYNK